MNGQIVLILVWWKIRVRLKNIFMKALSNIHGQISNQSWKKQIKFIRDPYVWLMV
jgi:hypothetical protein